MKLQTAIFCLAGGLCFTISGLGTGHFIWWYLSGLVTVASLVPVVRYGPRSFIAQVATILLALIVVGLVCTISEGLLFAPQIKSKLLVALSGGTVLYCVTTVVLATLGKVLKLNEAGGWAVQHRGLMTTIPFVLLAGASYVVYYEIFGVITFQFFTKPYYPHAAEQASAMGIWFFGYQWCRGLAMTLAILPVIYTLRMSRMQAAIAVGLLVWVVGGLGPLLAPNELMTGTLRFIHIVEIFTQNFALGVTATLLLRPKGAGVPVQLRSATAA
jgi:hypothetical protein